MRTNTFTINSTRKLGSCLMLFLAMLLHQASGQDVSTYYNFAATTGTFTPAPGAIVLGPATQDDNSYFGLNLGFTVNYRGTNYSQISVNSNGFITFGTSIGTDYEAIGNASYDNVLAAFNRDLQGQSGASLTFDTVGVAPYRSCIVQWLGYKKYGTWGAGDNVSFQIIIYETTNNIEFVYGSMTINGNSDAVQVGLAGDAGIDFKNRFSTTDWLATTAGTDKFDKIDITTSIVPPSGLIYSWTPAPLVYNTSVVSHPTANAVAPGATLQQIVKLNVNADGYVNYLAAASITVGTAGTTNLADISNLSVYYTGNTNTFSTGTQFGTTTAAPGATNTITDSVNLVPGDNYFWVTYDISASATLGNVIDASVSTVTVGNVPRTPTVTSPPGTRQISVPMTYVGATSAAAATDRVAEGTADNAVIKMMVITSPTGAPMPLTQFDLTANGTTDTSEIENIKIFYTHNSGVFNSSEQFGSTLATLPGTMNFTITGIADLENDTNYFWLAYDIAGGAVSGNAVDGEFTSVTVAGLPQTPTVTNPAGNRLIRQQYCTNNITAPANACSWGYYLTNVSTTGATTNISNPSGCSPSSNGVYMYSSNPLVVNTAQSVTLTLNGNLNWLAYAAWIDFDQNGVFDVSERVLMSPSTGMSYTATFMVPCTAVPGNTIMRVITQDWPNPITDPCSAPYVGEVEEYPVVINYLPVSYTSSTAVQQTGTASPGTVDKPVLRIPVRVDGCGVPVATVFAFNTAGSTAAADIASAKLYRTGTSATFNTSILLGTVAAPSGAFSFIVTDTLINNDITNYWLAYDIAGSATLSNVVDATFDNITAVSGAYVPTATNPSGNIQVIAPMTYMGSTTLQTKVDRVAQGSTNQEVLKVMLIMSSTGAPASLTQMDFTANGTTDTSDIENIKVYYTGNSSTFATGTQFGSTLANLPGTMNFSVTGALFLTNDTNYAWLTYDVKSGAVIGNVVDGECTSATIATIPQTPTVTNPAGSRQIRQQYCNNIITDPVNACNWGYYLTNVATTGATVDLSNPTGCSPSPTGVYGYPNTLVLNQAQTVSLTITGSSPWQGYAAFIDFDQDGIFSPAEKVLMSPSNAANFTASFVVPCTATPGNTLMRVITIDWPLPISNPCVSPYVGEVEEYPVTIIYSPAAYTSSDAIQQTGSASPGTVDKPVLRIPVKSDGCGAAVTTQLYFNTAGSTNAATDIASAKLYRTGTSDVFNTSVLLGTVAAPNGAFSFSVTDTLINSDFTNYWLAYTISGSATLLNVVDARFDSITAVGGTHIPTVTNPSGNIQVVAPMTYVGSDAVQTNIDRVAQGSSDQEVVKVMLIMSPTGAPATLSQMDFTANGTTDTSDIENISVYYTGNSSTFATGTQFGTTLASLPGTMNFNVTGSLFLNNDTNYLWLSYGIKSGAVIGNVVDGECTSATIAGVPQIPTVTAPSGSREIRQEYCSISVTSPNDACNWSYYLIGVSTSGATGDINNLTGCSPSVTGVYAYSSVPLTLSQSQTVSITVTGSSPWEGYAAFIDFNQDGIYSVSERVLMSPTNAANFTASFTVPCAAVPGNTTMRVISRDWPLPITDACTSPYVGEVEEYPVIILFTPAAYNTSSAVQQTGAVATGISDRPILRIPVKADGCGVATVENLYFNTTGTTAIADIASAKLYSTGTGTTFNTSKLLGTVVAPSGAFSFSITDTLNNNAFTNYWLAYDISGAATLSNFVDATVDSVTVLGMNHIPTVTNPSGNIQILNPMTYVSSTSNHPTLSKVEQGSTDNKVLQVMIINSSTGAPIDANQLDFTANGTTDTSNISNIKVYFTGNSSLFATTTQFGATLPNLPGTMNFSIIANQTLMNDTNYFWLTYDVSAVATIGNVIDAEYTSGVISGTPQTPTVTSPAGSRMVRTAYCLSNATSTGDEEIWNVTLGTLNNSSTCSSTGGSGSLNQRYSNYSSLPAPNVQRGSMNVITMTKGTCGGFYGEGWAVYIDFNQDGDLIDAGENVFTEGVFTGSAFDVRIGSITIPMTALLGETRMRITYVEGGAFGPCGTYNWGETEDYTINITPEPPPSSYVWNNALGGSFTDATNWTPNRTTIFANDKLMFNLGSTINVSSVPAQTVKTLDVANATRVNFSGSTAVFSVMDSITLDAGSKIYTGTTTTLTAGIDTNTIGGVYAAAGAGVNGILRRWKNAALTTVTFPLIDVAGTTRVATMTFSTPPTTGGSITSAFRNTIPALTGLPLTDGGITANKVAPDGYWVLTANNGLTGGQYDVSLNATAFGFVTDYTQTIGVYRATTGGAWIVSGTHAATAGSNAAPVLNRTGMSVYGQFGFASDSLINPLPVTLVKFTAANNKGNVIASWTTASEINNKGFEVQVSVNGQSFETVGFVKGAGNSIASLNYSYIHDRAFVKHNSTVLYYRLKQLDNDGKYSYSNAVKVSSSNMSQTVSAYPNPFSDNVNLTANTMEAAAMTITVTDLQGRTVATESVNLAKGNNEFALNLAHLAKGTYFIKTEVSGESTMFKLIKSE
jgi:hypothetical protein